MNQNVFNIPFGISFCDAIAKRFALRYKENPFDLTDVVFFVPNRRAVLSFKEAFLRQKGLKPFLLPKIKAIGDVNEDDVFLSSDQDCLADATPAVSFEERLFLFARLICSKHDQYGIKDISFEQALTLAADLAKLIDATYDEELSFEKLTTLVDEQYAEHWQETLKFLRIVTAFWPDILKERGLVDASLKRNMLLKQQAASWLQNPPKHKIVACGLSTAFEGLRSVLQALKATDNAEIYLYGLDRSLPKDVFDNISEQHPQFENKNLLALLGLTRDDVLDMDKSENSSRNALISKIMQPAEMTADWQKTTDNFDFDTAMKNVHFTVCHDDFEEARVIAVMMRETLETPEKTAVLITPDRTLARIVASELQCFGVDIDDSAGMPLHLTQIGLYFRQIIGVLENDFSPSSVAALLKNPYIKMGENQQKLRTDIRKNELEKRLPSFDDTPENMFAEDTLTKQLKTYFKELEDLYTKKSVPLLALLKAHIKTAEALAASADVSGPENLWRHDDGKKAAAYLAKILEKADVAGDISPSSYGAVLTTLLSLETVRKTYGTHPRLKILGLIEARFNTFDRVIIGGMNEGIWPQKIKTDPFMSRTMKKDFGLPASEKSVGITAFDLSSFLAAKEVFLTRSERSCGTPTDKSRYWLRFETLIRIFKKDIKDYTSVRYNKLAQLRITPEKTQKIKPVAPTPPVMARPRRFSASSIEKLMRNPYEIYARYILRLKVLDSVDKDLKQTVYGTIVHKVLEKFCLPDENTTKDETFDILMDLWNKEFSQYPFDITDKIFFSGRFEKTAHWISDAQELYRRQIRRSIPEVKGQIIMELPAGPVTIEARADRIDETTENTYNILDYKTGRARTPKEIKSGYAPQLAIEALIATHGGFLKDGIPLLAKKVARLIYWELGNKIITYDNDLDALIQETHENLIRLISAFDFESTPYLARPNPNHIDDYADYEHLARIKEWSFDE